MIKVDADPIHKVIKALEGVRRDIKRSEVRAVNYAAKRARTTARRLITDRYHLKPSYVQKNLWVSQPATAAKPEAILSARVRPVRLARYGARQLTQPGPYARGDRLRGIGAGRKQAGVSVKVLKAGARHKLRRAFLVPLKKGKRKQGQSENGKKVMGVFVRIGPGKSWKHDFKHLYSRSVDQIFGSMIKRRVLEKGIGSDLTKEFLRQLKL